MAGLLDAGYNALMKRNSVYLVFVFGGAILGERVVNGAFNRMWENNNKGKLFKDVKTGSGGGDEDGDE